MIKLIEGVSLSNLCDYSFGDQASIICNIERGYMKYANLDNKEFITKLQEIKKVRNYMTLFIDNIRLYKRELVVKNINDKIWINELFKNNDLLNLCSNFPDMYFIIFTNLEDTPIDSLIEDKIHNNILGIYAVNAIFNNDKIHPFPYGVQRQLNYSDTRNNILNKFIFKDIKPNNLLYVNHNVNTNYLYRHYINNLFENKKWALVDQPNLKYENFLNKILDNKFMICPIGNAIDCHRNWEVLYLKRVPIMKKHKYLELLFKDFPVLFVDDYNDVTENLLLNNEHLYQKAINLNLNTLDLDIIFNNIIKKYI